jgi:hypothetical protein
MAFLQTHGAVDGSREPGRHEHPRVDISSSDIHVEALQVKSPSLSSSDEFDEEDLASPAAPIGGDFEK